MEKEKITNSITFIAALIILFLVIILSSAGVIVYTLKVKDRHQEVNKTSEENRDVVDSRKILVKEGKTSYYSEDTREYNKFKISNEDELKAFRLIHTLSPEIGKDYLDNRTVFVQIKEETSGSNANKLINVTIRDNKVNFNISSEKAEIGTMDMATWYFIGSVPNEQLEGVDLKEWLNPIDIQKLVDTHESDV